MYVIITFAVGALILGAVILYARYVFVRLGRPTGMPTDPSWPWPSGRRLLSFLLAILFSLFVLLPAALFILGYPLGVGSCPVEIAPTGAWRCSAEGRLLSFLFIVAVLIPLAALWARLLLHTFVRPRK